MFLKNKFSGGDNFGSDGTGFSSDMYPRKPESDNNGYQGVNTVGNNHVATKPEGTKKELGGIMDDDDDDDEYAEEI